MISIGERLDNKYLVRHRLGSGGFGEVYLADDEAIPQRQVAIKVLSQPEESDHDDLVWEMQALARFNHPHVVAFYHHFNDGPCLFLAMEFCSGGSLEDRLIAAGRFPEERVFEWGVTLCDTLAFVHDKEIVHHDIKPQNILFSDDGMIKLGDFGVANRNIGTRMYMPPEMLLGEYVSRVDPRVDVYSLGVTLLKLLTGRHPFERLSSIEAIQARIAHDFVPLDLSRWVQEVLLKATHPTPELRFQTAADFGEAIRSRHVPYVFDGNRIKADALAKKAEAAIKRRKWKTAERFASYALELSPDCVAALLAAGRCQLLIRRTDQASEFFSKALSVNPRTPVQRELGWISLEQGRLPTAISLLTDHLQRNAADYEAYNLLLKCFYLTDRYEAGGSLARTLMGEKAPNDCFRNNQILCRMLSGGYVFDELEKLASGENANPFVAYNLMVALERPQAWKIEQPASLKSKLLFQEYQFGTARRAARENTLAISTPDGVRHYSEKSIVTIGSLSANDLVVKHRRVSRRHCAIVNYPDNVWLYDLGSTVGTLIDEQPLVSRVFLDGVHKVVVGEVPIRIGASKDLLI
ncbi:protein kinase [Planctomycetota bacterium]